MISPTPAQIEHCRLAEQDMLELIRRLQTEGMDLRIILAGIGTATAAVMFDAWGPEAPSIWFAQQSAMTMPTADRG